MNISQRIEVKVLLSALFLLILSTGRVSAQQDQQQRLDQMKAKGVDASLTILPVGIAGEPMDAVSLIIGVLLEEKGLKDIGIGNMAFRPPAHTSLKALADSVGKFIKEQPVTTEYALYAEMNGDLQRHVFTELIGVVVDKAGEVVWTMKLDTTDGVFINVSDPDPMGYSILLADVLAPNFGLNAETAKNAKPGKMASMFREKFGMPVESETAPLPDRQKVMKENFKKSTLMVFPVRANGEADIEGAAAIIKMINDAGLCTAVSSKDSLLLKSKSWREGNEMQVLWDMADKFREYLKANPRDADYLLYADYAYSPTTWQQGYVHFVVCDRNGEWVIADLQNSGHPEYQEVKPTSVEGCNKLMFTALERYLKTSVANVIRETINTSGTEAGTAKFKELLKNLAGYNLSEGEMNALGYEYLFAKKYAEAIAVFKMNAEAFPESWNTYDSLGEAYAAAGEKDKAIENYEKSLKLNPESPGGQEALKKLKAQ